MATASINHAIQVYRTFQEIQAKKVEEDENFRPLNIACVFSPPADGDKDIKQLQEDLQQEKADNEQEPEKKKEALTAIIADYNLQYKTNHRIHDFDLYYQDVQQRIKDQKYPNADHPHRHKIDITIVVDMLLTGFDAQYLNTLYVDKNLKYHGLIQAFSRTNRILTGAKPHGNILDFRQQQAAVDEAIGLFSGKKAEQAKKIWLVESAPVVAAKFVQAVAELEKFMHTQGLANKPEQVSNLRGDTARIGFVEHFKEVQRLKTQLEQYTDLGDDLKATLEKAMPTDDLRSFRARYIEVARQFKPTGPGGNDPVRQFDFEFVLFASALIDYDYIMALLARSQGKPAKGKMTREQIIEMLSAYSNMADERDDMVAYIQQLDFSKGLSETEIRDGFQTFKTEKNAKALAEIAQKHGLETPALQAFTDEILTRMIFDGEKLSELLAPLGLGWKARSQHETALMTDLIPFLHKLANGRDIAGLKVYEA